MPFITTLPKPTNSMTTSEQQTPDPRAPKPDDMIHFAFHPSIPKPESVPWDTYEFALRDTSKRWRERYTLLKDENTKLRADIQTMNDRCTEITNDHIAATKRNVHDNQVLRVQNEALIADRDRWRECAEKLNSWMLNLDLIAYNSSNQRKWRDGCGWIHPFMGVYYASDLERKAALAEYTRCAEGVATSGWRDIATAPRDGTYVLLWSRVPIVARWSKAQADKFPKHNGWDFPGPGFLKPTHWMPLPQPPQPTDV